MKKIFLALIFIFIPCICFSASISRDAIVKVLVDKAYNQLNKNDFEEVRVKGETYYRAMNPNGKPYVVGLRGPKNNLSQVMVICGLNEENSILAMLMFVAVAETAAPSSGEWIMAKIPELAGKEGGDAIKKFAGKTVLISVTSPNLMTLNIN